MNPRTIMNTPRSATIVAFVVLFTGFILWAGLTDLDYGVHAQGTVASLNPNVPIQHNAVARVTAVQVQEGDRVRAGQPLLTLNNADALAGALQAETQRLVLGLQMESLLAEQRGSSELPFPQAASGVVAEETIRQAHADTLAALRQRLLTRQAELARFDNDLASARIQYDEHRHEIAVLEAQTAIVARQLAGLEAMLPEGLIARSTVDDQRYRLEELKRSRLSLNADLERLSGLIKRTESERQVYLANQTREIKSRLAEMAPQIKGVEQTTAAAMIRLRSHAISAPADGQVINVKVKATDEVITPGEILMEFVPDARRYYVSAQVPPAEVEAARPGQHAEIRFVTLPSKSTPMMDGRLVSISGSATKDEKLGESYYIAQVEFEGDVAKAIGMEPVLGMPVSVLLKGGRRSVMSYIIEPFKALMMRTMKEQ